jgi:hypothetical protein
LISADDVRAALRTQAVLDHYAWKVKKSGSELESCACPERADHNRRSFVINAKTGRWQCFPCGTSGDLFDFIALVERLRMPADFSAVVEKAAEIAGVGASTMSDDERRAKREAWSVSATGTRGAMPPRRLRAMPARSQSRPLTGIACCSSIIEASHIFASGPSTRWSRWYPTR